MNFGAGTVAYARRHHLTRISYPNSSMQEVDYIVPTLTASLLSILARDFMWTRLLSCTPMFEKEVRERQPERLRGIGAQIDKASSFLADKVRETTILADNLSMQRDFGGDVSSGGVSGGYLGGFGGGRGGFDLRGGAGGGMGATTPGGGGPTAGIRVPPTLVDAAVAADAVCGEMCKGFALQRLKDVLFNLRKAEPMSTSFDAAPLSFSASSLSGKPLEDQP